MSTKSTRLSATCQEIHFEDFSDPVRARVVVRACLQDSEIWPTIDNHKCNGVRLCPSSFYADMAEGVAKYIWKTSQPGRDVGIPGINVCDMHVVKTTIVKTPQEGKPQWIEMEAYSDVPEMSSGLILDSTVRCTIRGIDPNGKKLDDLVHCSVLYEWIPGWTNHWSNYTGLIRTKIDNLKSRAQTESSGDVRLMYRDTIYQMFQSFVDYGPKYQNMAEAICDNQTLEATARLVLQPDPAKDYTGPYYLDASCHLSGFICNAVEEDSTKNAYISHGWKAMKLTPDFRPAPGADIKNYVHMQVRPEDKTILEGDVYVLQDNEIVGVWEGVQFKKIPRRILNVFLPPPKK